MARTRPARAVKKIKRDTAATETDIDAALQPEDTFEQLFGGYDDLSDDESGASDASEYVRKRGRLSTRKRARKQAKSSSHKLTMTRSTVANAPAADPLSDNEYDDNADSRYGIDWLKARSRTPAKSGREASNNNGASTISTGTGVAKVDQSTPNVLQIHVHAGSEKVGHTINVDLTPLLKAYNPATALTINPNDDDTLIGAVDDSTISVTSSAVLPSLRLQRLGEAKARADAAQKVKTNFIDLPNEIRVRIYRLVFVSETPIDFHSRTDFQRSSSLLRACKIVHEEGRAVLYGENAFHFERSHATRGKFFEDDWREIGFKDIRRFLETIGNTNISMMCYVSFEFSDATKGYGATEELERRFVNDPIVWRCLELIGSNTHLIKFACTFAGRRNLDRTDLHFLRALAGIKAQEVVNVSTFSGGYKAKPELVADLKKLMVAPHDDPEKVDEKKKKKPTVIMHHERNRGTYYHMQTR